MINTKDKNLIISITLNIIIAILVIAATIIMFTGFKFMSGHEISLDISSIEMLKFFTVQSNILMGITSIIFLIEEIMLLKRKIKSINKKYYLLKLASTSAVTLTFVIVFIYLGPITEYGIISLLMNSNLFYHLLIPLLSIIAFIFFEKSNLLNIKDTIYGIIPTIIYAVFYIINVLIHTKNGIVSPKYDWYWFVQNGVWTAVIVAPIILLISYLISIVLYRLNHKKDKV